MQWVPKRVKVEHLLYILRSSGPRRVGLQRHQCYTTCWGRSCCKKSTVPYLPIRPLFTGVTQKGKVENLLYILRSSEPRRVQRHQCYTTCWGRSSRKKTTVPYLPIHPNISQGHNSAAPTRVNLGPRHISETITGRKSKFYVPVQLHRVKYTFGI